jgi:ATP-dependent DNA helicase RecG
MRPYNAPTSLGKTFERKKYIRVGSKSIITKGPHETRLDELTARIPFDDRINQNSSLENLDLGLIQAYLKHIKSELYEESKSISFTDLCRKMNIIKGPDEFLRPINAGLMFFNENPDKFFDRAFIDVVVRKDDFGKEFSEQRFTGPLNKQLKDAFDFIKNNVIRHEIRKVESRPEAPKISNYPNLLLKNPLQMQFIIRDMIVLNPY